MEIKTEGFYTATRREESQVGSLTVQIRLNPQHWVYRAHFPAMPVTPGVCILQMIGEQLSAHKQRPLQLVYAKNIKFLRLLNPEEFSEIELHLRYETDGEIVRTQATVCSTQTIFVKASLVYQ